MEILISYSSRWCNSFLDGSNNMPIPRGGRKFIASNKNLNDAKKGEECYIERDITHDTVMGILNRLIGDQRKLYQSREEDFGFYYFKDKEDKISFEVKPTCRNENTATVLRVSDKTVCDKTAFSGLVNSNHSHFTSDYSKKIWSVLFLDLNGLFEFVKTGNLYDYDGEISPFSIDDRMSVIKKMKALEIDIENTLIVTSLKGEFGDISYHNTKNRVVVESLYCSALYLAYGLSTSTYDMSGFLTDRGFIRGFAKRMYTSKDFMDQFASGKKRVWTTAYTQTIFKKGVGKIKRGMNMEDGFLKVIIDCGSVVDNELREIISNASVGTFNVGKKGFGYIVNIT